VKEIALTRGLTAIVDEEDFDRLIGFKWYAATNSSGGRYARRSLYDQGIRGWVFMHQEIMPPRLGLEIDHKNCDGLDNRRENLRYATRAQQQANRRPWGSSGLRGVRFDPNSPLRPWRAKIALNRTVRRLGSFASKEEAARAYDAAAILIHGEFARLNFPEEVA
jgi:hypothetical protein